MLALALLGLGTGQVRAADPKLDKHFIQETITAAESGDAAAQCALGACFEAGKGMLKDFDEAAKWYRRAAVQGDPMGACALAACYEKGRGVTKDPAEAAKWYTQAADKGYTKAQTKLGGLYAEGTGVDKDLVQAHKWYQAAAAKGDATARAALSKLEKKMTSTQLAAAKEPAPPAVGARTNQPQSMASAPSATSTNRSTTQGTGAGFFITEDGYLITAAHLVKGTPLIELVTPAGRVPAKIVKSDLADDLALLKANGKFTALSIIPSRTVRAGARVALTAFPASSPDALTPLRATGEIKSLTGTADDPRFFQAAIPFSAACTGSALTDEHGNVIGVMVTADKTEAAAAGTLHQALKSSFLLSFLESVPEIAARLPEAHAAAVDANAASEAAQAGSVIVLVY